VGRSLAWNIHESGYAYVHLRYGGQRTCARVNRLVAETWIGDVDGMHVNHKNGDRLDNRVENLEIVTASENVVHSYAVLHRPPAAYGSTHHRAKLTAGDVLAIRALAAFTELTQGEIGAMFNVADSRVSRIVNRKAWRHV
jgi:hypothetical protein